MFGMQVIVLRAGGKVHAVSWQHGRISLMKRSSTPGSSGVVMCYTSLWRPIEAFRAMRRIRRSLSNVKPSREGWRNRTQPLSPGDKHKHNLKAASLGLAAPAATE